MKYLLFIASLVILFSCSHTEPEDEKQNSNSEVPTEDFIEETVNQSLNNCIDSVLNSLDLVDIQSVDSTILVDLKYASDDNFMHQQLYFTINKLYLQEDVAQRLAACQHYLQSIHPGYRLLVYDGVRPVEVQQRMWDALDTIPVAQRGKFVSNPKNHSVHNYGAAIDLTIVDEHKQPLDMGAGYDDIRTIAYPSMEDRFLASGELQQYHIENRKLLRKVMRHQGFINIPSEWWHFNAYSRNEIKKKYPILMKEPRCE